MHCIFLERDIHQILLVGMDTFDCKMVYTSNFSCLYGGMEKPVAAYNILLHWNKFSTAVELEWNI